MSSAKSESPGSRRIRWWPALLILAIAVGMLARIWLQDTGSTQHKVVPSILVLFCSVSALFAWLVLFSRLSRPFRLKVFLAGIAVAILGVATLEVKGVDGNLVPIVGWRWSSDRSFDTRGSSVAPTTVAAPDDYPQFYGPDRAATVNGLILARDWQRQAPREIWRRDVGEGWSSFAIVGTAAVTQELRGEDEVVVRYGLRTGEQVWVHSDRAPFETTVGGSGPRATPTIADGRVYAMGATGILNCLELDSGARIWSRNVLDDHGVGQPSWGMSGSPLLVDDNVIVHLGKQGAGLAAYDRATGEPVWTAGEDGGTYSSPLLATILGQKLVLMVNRDSLTGHDPASGEVVFEAAWPNPAGGERISMPLIVADNRVLVSAGYGVGSRLFELRRDGAQITADLLWESPRLKSKFAPMVLHDGVVFGLDDGVLVALDPATGERLWKRGRYGHGQMILVDDLLLILGEKGELFLVEASREGHRELARLTVLAGKSWNPPALKGNLLLVRNNREAACYELPTLN
jgi:outer membrane protein assembly factor BamB